MTKRCAVYCGCGPILIISYNIVQDDTAVRRDREQKKKKRIITTKATKKTAGNPIIHTRNRNYN